MAFVSSEPLVEQAFKSSSSDASVLIKRTPFREKETNQRGGHVACCEVGFL